MPQSLKWSLASFKIFVDVYWELIGISQNEGPLAYPLACHDPPT